MAKQLWGISISKFIVIFLLGAAAALPLPMLLRNDPLLASGHFSGKSGHAAAGGVSLLKTANGIIAILEPDFSVDSSPDPRLGFGRDGHYEKATQFSLLNSSTGAQIYHIPEGVNLTDYNEFWVWCEKFQVAIGAAKLE
jgi:hypothetical protein